jgi:hypothetical protein
MSIPKTAEQLVYFMKSNLSLNRFDERFLSSVQNLTSITTNQVELFYKIVYKYRRQFLQHDLFVENLIQLPWKLPVIESLPAYTNAHVITESDKIIFRCPYNREFINNFNKNSINTFKWIREKKQYESKYGQYELKMLLNSIDKYFKEIKLCDKTLKLISDLETYKDVTYWQPTLVKVNNRIMLAATNETLNNIISEQDYSTDLASLSKLVSYGVTIDPSLYDVTDDKSNFFTKYFSKYDVKDIPVIVSWIKELKCDQVLIYGLFTHHPFKQNFLNELKKYGIKSVNLNTHCLPDQSVTEPSVLIKFKTKTSMPYIKNLVKVVEFDNKEPINIK